MASSYLSLPPVSQRVDTREVEAVARRGESERKREHTHTSSLMRCGKPTHGEEVNKEERRTEEGGRRDGTG